MKTITTRSDCPISYALDLFGDKWTLLILRDMMFYNKSSYSEFLCSKEKIARNILTDRLSSLLKEGFVAKLQATSNKSKFIYTLTEKGIALVPLMLDLIEWGARFSPEGGPTVILSQLSKNRKKTILDLQKKLSDEASETLKLNPEIQVI